ncbi:4-hydroxythreonine-4-phosphate dehydrogenase PdxA [Desulfonatronospira sp.]|uniref:4-hydroxythreonine-4-phosphate dehydrogenase PdxA n=1 Tax=Desulfonatronospira sp. TaxID=1962951 RepID=UPI0025BA17D7|nr:4-hydroxythreonine-4-phosphate dehydrogenase PdxA [Desulfonatronospira sp.]
MSFVLYTIGDPNGLGPELLMLAQMDRLTREHAILVMGPEKALEYHAGLLQRRKFWTRIDDLERIDSLETGVYLYQPAGLENFEPMPGRKDVSGGYAAGAALSAASLFLKNNHDSVLTTGPLNKQLLQEAGFDFPGHTEFLAHQFGMAQDQVCMHLCGDRLRVSLVTTHLPLYMVPAVVSSKKILRCLRLTHAFMVRLGVDHKPLAVCGLNPHAGEEGRTGSEELDVVMPAIEQAQREYINVQGPFAADTVFYRAMKGEFSAVLAMYHDQGLAPLKLVEFGQCVNVTLGLPVVRTSVDHGTGYELVGTGKASPRSLEKAFDLALRLAPEVVTIQGGPR